MEIVKIICLVPSLATKALNLLIVKSDVSCRFLAVAPEWIEDISALSGLVMIFPRYGW